MRKYGFLIFFLISATAYSHGDCDHPHDHSDTEKHQAYLQSLSQRLLDLKQSEGSRGVFEDPEVKLLGVVSQTLLENYRSDLDSFPSSQLLEERKALASHLIEATKAKWTERPRSLTQGAEALKHFFLELGHLISELPSEIAARAYGGFFEFGALYLAVVIPTYPPWFIASEAMEHAILGAPLGLACTHLQLGYFFVVGAMLAPGSMVCHYLASDAEKTPLTQKLSRAGSNLLKGLRDFLSYRKYKKDSAGGEVNGLTLTEIKNSAWRKNLEGPMKNLSKHPLLWSSMDPEAVEARSYSRNADDSDFRRTWLSFVIAKHLLNEAATITKQLKERHVIGFRQYMQLLKEESLISKALRRALVIESKVEGEGPSIVFDSVLPRLQNHLAVQNELLHTHEEVVVPTCQEALQ